MEALHWMFFSNYSNRVCKLLDFPGAFEQTYIKVSMESHFSFHSVMA